VRRRLAIASAAALLAAVLGAVPSAQARDRYDVKVLARVPPPGYPALSYVAPDRTIYVSTFFGPNSSNVPANVLAYKPYGTFLDSYTIDGETGSQNGVQVAAMDANGLLYLLDQSPPRVLTFDPRTRRQSTYATFKDVPPCMPPGSGGDCSETAMDNPAEPDYAAWGTDGSMYVTDYQQGVIWRVPPGGGEAHVWFASPQLDGAQFGPAGIVLMPDHHTLMIAASAGPAIGPSPTTGKIYTLPIQPDGKPGTLKQLWESGPAEAPDGFALARSGNIYLALVGPNVNQLVVLSPDGKQIARISHDGSGGNGDIPFDSPSSVQFDGDRMIVTNDAYFTGTPSHWAIFDVFAGEQGAPIYVPPKALTPGGPPPSHGSPIVLASRYSLRVKPKKLHAGHRQRVRFRAAVSKGGAKASAYGRSRIKVAGHTLRTSKKGAASIFLRPRKAGKYTVRLLPPHGRRTLAKATLRVSR
jgi:sugar lactone lactonase YvrE